MKLYITFQITTSHPYLIFLGVSFTPREEGEHLITIKKNGQITPKSPFRIKVDKSQVSHFLLLEITSKYLNRLQ